MWNLGLISLMMGLRTVWSSNYTSVCLCVALKTCPCVHLQIYLCICFLFLLSCWTTFLWNKYLVILIHQSPGVILILRIIWLSQSWKLVGLKPWLLNIKIFFSPNWYLYCQIWEAYYTLTLYYQIWGGLLCLSFVSSADDIISGANSMPRRLSGVNVSSNQIGSLSFHPIFVIFGLNVHNNIVQKVVEVEFRLFAFGIFNGSLITKNMFKIGNFGGFWPFSQKVCDMGQWNLIYRHIVGIFRCVSKMASHGGPNFRALF